MLLRSFPEKWSPGPWPRTVAVFRTYSLHAQRLLRRLPLRFILLVFLLAITESYLHRRSFSVHRPSTPLDPPFATSCREPDLSAPRENAVFVMMARNSEREQAQHTIISLEQHFNRWFTYPIIFFNDEEWEQEFIDTIRGSTSANVSFEVIPPEVWGFPEGMDADAARAAIKEQEERKVFHGGEEGYHRMCRFYSGQLYNLAAMQPYRWYWRLDPDTDFFCALTYDPFAEMARTGKVYGYTIALRELLNTVPSLFARTSAYKEARGLPTLGLWRATVDAAVLPWPLRGLLGMFLDNRDRHGDVWSGCHYWSNFEIGDMNFFRGRRYQDYFQAMDEAGGFFFERWGDAPIHSLGVAMLLEPSQVHHFEDIGYRHGKFHQCPDNAPGGQLLSSETLNGMKGTVEKEGGIGCRCDCGDKTVYNFRTMEIIMAALE
ncbi:hypothetical protein BN1708_007629 [Verticillium longisporum]|uniref:Glycosyltransferase family 15 protein n=1 Tax=Verticillium longisporum TaxID=100787 RepID=A0A0G4MUN7_VERLO|nr:hypothetical protein BN1708_007629 [Verticillium longisporum]